MGCWHGGLWRSGGPGSGGWGVRRGDGGARWGGGCGWAEGALVMLGEAGHDEDGEEGEAEGEEGSGGQRWEVRGQGRGGGRGRRLEVRGGGRELRISDFGSRIGIRRGVWAGKGVVENG